MSKKDLTHNPFVTKFNNSFVDLRGKLNHNLDRSRSKVAVAIREKQAFEARLKSTDRETRLQAQAEQRGLWIALSLRKQAQQDTKELDQYRDEILKAAMQDPTNSHDLFVEAAEIAKKLEELRTNINHLNRLIKRWDADKKTELVEYLLTNDLVEDRQ